MIELVFGQPHVIGHSYTTQYCDCCCNEGSVRTLEVVYPFAIQDTHSDFNTSLATSEKVDKVSDFWGSGGLLLHDEVYILDAYTELLE